MLFSEENDKFKRVNVTQEFEVYKKPLIDPELIISVGNIAEGQDALIEINANSAFSSQVHVMIDLDVLNIQTVNVVNGFGFLTWEGLKLGNHTATAFWDAIDDFAGGANSTDFEVYPKELIDPELRVSVENVNIGESVLVKVYVNETFSGDVDLMINNSDSTYLVPIVGGYGEFEISDLPIGSYMATVVFNGTDTFRNSTATAEFEVYHKDLIDPNLTASVSNVTAGESVLIEIHTNDTFNGNVSVTVNGSELSNLGIANGSQVRNVEIANGYGSVAFDDLASGNYTATVRFNETEVFRKSKVTVEFEVRPNLVDPNLSISISNITYGEQLVVELGTNATFSGNVTFKFNGSEESYHVNITEGYGKLTLDNINAGRYIAFAAFHHTDVFQRSIKWTKFEVYPANTSLSAIVDDVVVGESSNLQISLFDESGNPIDGIVTISINGEDTNVTVTGGKITVPVVPAGEIGVCSVTITYLGDENHGSSVLNADITVYGPGNVTVKHTDAGDAADIQAAIDSANPGDTIRLGKYSYAGVVDVNITESVTIAGTEGTIIASAGDGTPIFNVLAISDNGSENLTITGVDFKLANGDTVVKATADNDTENPLSIVTPSISITDNSFELVNDTTVPESIRILELDSERGVLSPTGEIAIAGNTISAGIGPFKFEVTSINSGGDTIIVPQNISDERKATVIVFENMNTTAVSKDDGGKTGEYFVWRLTDADGNPLAITPMEIGFNGVVYTYEKDGIITDDDCYAKLQINLGYKGVYTFAICFLGNDEYNASFVVAKITVDTQKPSLAAPNKSYAASAKTKTLTATFKTANGNPIADKWITFTVNGKIYKAKTNANGIASVNVSINKKGTYAFVAKFAGDSTYAAINKTAILTIS